MRKRAKYRKACAILTAFAMTATFMPGMAVQAAPEQTEPVQVSSENPSLKLWYDEMAGTNASGNAYDTSESFYKALPIGNGRVGAMVYGNYPTEKFDLNEATFWSGGPGKNDKAGAADKIDQAKQLVYDGQYSQADSFVSSNIIGGGEAKYQSVGTLELQFGHDEVSDYSRQLDMNTGVVSSQYTYDGKQYLRESFVSYPDEIMVTRITCDTPGSVSFTAKYSSSLTGQYEVSTDGDDTLVMDGHADDGAGVSYALWYQTRTKVMNENGEVSADGTDVTVTNADSVVLLTSIRTNFVDYQTVTADQKALAAEDIERASQKTYEELYEAFEADYTELFDRVDLQLGGDSGENKTPMRTRIQQFSENEDPDLVEILFQYGRYLMICGSRDSQPLNLQGLWNKFRNPAWDSKYTTNINYEMNYWPALTTNLEECFQPFVEKAIALSEAGNYTARNTFGIEDGWVVNHNTDLWNRTGPIDGAWGLWPVGGGWISNQLYDAYNFNQDADYLSKIYPVVSGSADFLQQLMDRIEINGQEYEVIAPSNSPELSFRYDGGTAYLSASVTMDNGISRELFQNVIEASETLRVDEELRGTLEEKISLIRPDQIGADGTLMEWAYDWQNTERQHRHISHLYNLFPGNMIDKTNTPLLAEAVQNTLNVRGDEGTGWSEGWKLNTWARLEDGNHAYNLVKLLISPVDNNGRLYDNLWDAHPPFQIDGNFGFTSGIAEMLLQSDNDQIKLLPALPDAWSDGHVSGLRARGNFEISEYWESGELTEVTIVSNSGNICNVSCGDKYVSFPTVAGQTYTLNGDLEFAQDTKTYTNLALDKAVTASNDTSESAAAAVDGSADTVWEDTTDNSMGGQWIAVDLGAACDISHWKVSAPGTEDINYVPRAFILQKSDDGETWYDVDAVYGNQMDVNTRNVATFTTRYVRLYIETATQDDSGGARISEFEVWGTDESVPVTEITLDQTELTIGDGNSVSLTAQTAPADASNKTVIWTSGDPAIAEVSDTGIVTGIAPGETEITAASYDGSVTAVCKVTVTPVSVESVQLNKDSVDMEIGGTEQLEAQITPSNASNQKVTWESSDPEVVSVDESGLVTALAEGSAQVTVTTEDGQLSDVCEFTVVKVLPRNVALNAEASAEGHNPNEEPGKAVDGSTSTKWCLDGKGNTLTLDLGAKYTIDRWVLVSAGIAESTDFNTRGCTLQMSENGEEWTDVDVVTDNTATTMERTVEPFTTRYVRLVVDEPVQPNAASWAVAARIHELELWGVPAPVPVESVTLDFEELELTEGDTAQLTAVIEPADAENQNITWTSDDETVAYVDAQGLVTAVSAGRAVITVTTEDGSFTAECLVKVRAEKPVSKNTLEYFLNEAKTHWDNGDADDCVQSVQDLFKEAIAEGEAVMADEYVTREEVQSAALKLMKAVQALNMKAADKMDLEMAVELAEMIDLDDYVSAGQQAFTDALAAAEDVLDDGDAMQPEADSAWNALVNAMSELRLKADKTVLETILNEAADLDLTLYTEETVAVYNMALASAMTVYADPEISVEDQQIVDDAVTALRSAADGLVLKPDDGDAGNTGSGDTQEPDDEDAGNTGSGDTQEPDDGDAGNAGSSDTQEPDDGDSGNAGSGDTQKPDDGNTGNAGNQGSSTQTAANGNAGNNHSSSGGASADKAAKTGDTAPLTGLLALIMVSGAAVAVTLRKRSR